MIEKIRNEDRVYKKCINIYIYIYIILFIIELLHITVKYVCDTVYRVGHSKSRTSRKEQNK